MSKTYLRLYGGEDVYSCKERLDLEIEHIALNDETYEVLKKHSYVNSVDIKSQDDWFIFEYKKLLQALAECLDCEGGDSFAHTIIGILGSDVTKEEGGFPYKYYKLSY